MELGPALGSVSDSDSMVVVPEGEGEGTALPATDIDGDDELDLALDAVENTFSSRGDHGVGNGGTGSNSNGDDASGSGGGSEGNDVTGKVGHLRLSMLKPEPCEPFSEAAYRATLSALALALAAEKKGERGGRGSSSNHGSGSSSSNGGGGVLMTSMAINNDINSDSDKKKNSTSSSSSSSGNVNGSSSNISDTQRLTLPSFATTYADGRGEVNLQGLSFQLCSISSYSNKIVSAPLLINILGDSHVFLAPVCSNSTTYAHTQIWLKLTHHQIPFSLPVVNQSKNPQEKSSVSDLISSSTYSDVMVLHQLAVDCPVKVFKE